MTQPADEASQLALSRGPTDPDQYSSPDAKARFSVAKYYGMGSDGQWTVGDIADALNVSTRQVYRYLNESEIGREVEEALAVSEAEWRLDAALHLRRELDRLEDIERELLQSTATAPTEFDEETVEGIPTGNDSIVITNIEGHEMKFPIPTEYQEIIDYGPELERVNKEKRQYIDQIMKLLGLEIHDGGLSVRGPSENSDRELVVYRVVGGDSSDDDAR